MEKSVVVVDGNKLTGGSTPTFELLVLVQISPGDTNLIPREVAKAMQRRVRMWKWYDIVAVLPAATLLQRGAEEWSPGEAMLLPGNIWLWRRWRELDVWQSYVRRFLTAWSDAYVVFVKAEQSTKSGEWGHGND